MSGYTKLFSVILASTIWEADMPTRIVWITLLAMKDKTGKVEASIPGLATLARVPVAQVRQAIENLKAPDPDSRSKIEEGRRIRDVDGGWYVINHEKYRNMLNADERREYLRVKQAEFRARKSKSTEVNNVNNVSDKYTESTHTDPYTDADPDTKKSVRTTLITAPAESPAVHQPPHQPKPIPAPTALEFAFNVFWEFYPRKVGKAAARRIWLRLKPDMFLRERITSALAWQIHSDAWTKDGGAFIPHPSSYLHQGRWDDEPVAAQPHVSKLTAALQKASDW